MKRVISILSAISVLASCSVATVSSSAATEDEVDTLMNDVIDYVNQADYVAGYNSENYLLSDEETEKKIADGSFKKGDVNLDGTVDFYDVSIIMRSCVYRLSTEDDYSSAEASYSYYTKNLNWSDKHYNLMDYNGDGVINSSDAVLIYKSLINSYVNDDSKFAEAKNKVNVINSDDVTDNYFKALTKYAVDSDSTNEFFSLYDVTMGDNNLDGKVDSRDAVEILKSFAFSIISGNSSEVEENNIADFNSDTNFDGKVDSSDAVVTLKIYANSLIK
jgi:hypothetical protein